MGKSILHFQIGFPIQIPHELQENETHQLTQPLFLKNPTQFQVLFYLDPMIYVSFNTPFLMKMIFKSIDKKRELLVSQKLDSPFFYINTLLYNVSIYINYPLPFHNLLYLYLTLIDSQHNT